MINPPNTIWFLKRVKLIKCCMQVRTYYSWICGFEPMGALWPMGWSCDELLRPNTYDTFALSMQTYLSAAEFKEKFGMSKENFYKQPKWKQNKLKVALQLFWVLIQISQFFYSNCMLKDLVHGIRTNLLHPRVIE